ncbi:MAG: iron donor protein CyaY [Pseudomonadales bacterium]|jgi:CyaY protein
MNDREFEDRVDELFNGIEDYIDELDEQYDIDVDTTGGMLSVDLADGGSIILSRQIANHEVWVAAKSGGFHLSLKQEQWSCATTGETLGVLLNRVFTEQLGQAVSIF